jgi:AcrR family transcriptional regulator
MTDKIIHSSVRAASISQPEMRERILHAAEKMFREHGYLKVTVKDVALDLGMSPANVYRFFESKAALREALVSKLTHQVEEVAQRAVYGSGCASERLTAMIVECHRMTLDRYLTAVNAHEMLDTAIRENWNVIDYYTDQIKRLIKEVILDGVHSGEFNVTDVDSATRLIYIAIIPFIDPTKVALLFVNDVDFKQARGMCAFIVGALKGGCV